VAKHPAELGLLFELLHPSADPVNHEFSLIGNWLSLQDRRHAVAGVSAKRTHVRVTLVPPIGYSPMAKPADIERKRRNAAIE
jgi:hypothetical protein